MNHQLITNFSQQINTNQFKALMPIFLSSKQFNLLEVYTNSGQKIFSYKRLNSTSLFSALLPKVDQVNLPIKNIRISFQVNYDQQITMLLYYLIALLAFGIVFSFISTSSSKHFHEKSYITINQQIKNVLNALKNDKKIKDNEFNEIPEFKPIITELKSIISSQRSTSLAFENQALTDNLTGLNNRNKFVQFFENKISIEGDVKFGVLLITRCTELQSINKIRGFNDGDQYICHVAKIMQSVISTFGNGQIYRMNGSDFATILPNVKIDIAEKYAQELTLKFNEYQRSDHLDSIAYTGLAPFKWQDPLGELLAIVDTGISIAQTQSINSWFVQENINPLKNSGTNYGHQSWRQEIDNVIENRKILLLVQPIQPNSRNSKVYGEILTRFINSNDEMLPTTSFIAMAEKLNKIVEIDRLIIETAIDEIKNKHLLDKSFGLNVSARSIIDEHFLIWLERKLLKNNDVASRLIFEITESGLQQNITHSKRFIDMLHRSGARITVERFGIGLTSFKFFRDLKPDFIKMDSMYTRDINDDKNNQYFLRLMVDLAHRISVNVLAESVETIEEKHILEKLFIDGCQGYYISKPEPM